MKPYCRLEHKFLPVIIFQVYVLESSEVNKNIIKEFSSTNKLSDRISFITKLPSEVARDDFAEDKVTKNITCDVQTFSSYVEELLNTKTVTLSDKSVTIIRRNLTSETKTNTFIPFVD